MRLRTFGGLVLEGSSFTRPKPLLLLTYLALEGPQDRRHVAELFWPGARDHMKSLTVALARLRKGAPGVVKTDGERAWATVDTDAGRFLALLEHGNPERALELYEGPFLHRFYLRAWGAELEEWVYQTRDFLAARARGALLEVAEREAAQAQFDKAAKRAEAAFLLAGIPEVEELSRLYLLLCAGNSPQAGEVRREAAAFGMELLGSPEEARGYLRQGGQPTPHNLPTRGTAFVGRDLELTELATLLSKPHCRLLSLVGPAGVGKTRLALQIAREHLPSASFRDGIYFVSLVPLAAADLIPSTMADALGLEQGSREMLPRVIEHLADKDLLLILDNFEHLFAQPPKGTDGAAIILELIRTCPRLKLLVTSRERLNLEEERIFPVAGLPFPTSGDLAPEDALRFDAVRLFVRRAVRARPDFELTQNNVSDVLQICRLVEGLPLGLELSATWVRVMSPREIASEMAGNLDVLTTSTRDVPERHRSLRSAFEHSWRLLSSKEQEVLRKLAVFRGGFRRKGASEVAGATIPVLGSLVDKSLLRVDNTGRYNRHPLLYQYTQDKLAHHPEERTEAGAKHAAYFLRLAEESRPKLLRPEDEGETGALKTLAVEHDNLRAALAWSLDNDRALALRLASALRTFWEIRGYLSEACGWLKAALAEPEDVSPRTRFAARTAYGRFLLLCGQKDRAAEQFEAALELARATGHPRDTAEALNHSGLLALERGDPLRAQSLCEQALALHRAHGNERGVAVTLNHLGNIARCQRHHPEAAALYTQSLTLNRELGIRRSEAIALGNLGFVARQQGEGARAAKLLGESVAIRHELGDEVGLAHSFLGLAGVLVERQDYEQAARLLGITDRVLEATSVELALADRRDYNHTVATARAQLSKELFARAWTRGYTLSTDRAVAEALELAGAVSVGGE